MRRFELAFVLVAVLGLSCDRAKKSKDRSDPDNLETQEASEVERSFQTFIETIKPDSTSESVAAGLLSQQLSLLEKVPLDKQSAFVGEKGRCLLFSSKNLPEVPAGSGLTRSSSNLVIYTNPQQQSSNCEKVLRDGLSQLFASAPDSFAITFFSYTF